jgi:hypothetical protein
MVEQTVNLMRDHLIDFIGTHTFEELCRDWVAVQADTGALPFLPERIGSFWSQEAQVDVVAVNWRTKDILLGECKWGTDAVGRSVIRALAAKTGKVLPGDRWNVHYVFFARQGFTATAQEEARKLAASRRISSGEGVSRVVGAGSGADITTTQTRWGLSRGKLRCRRSTSPS